MSNGYNGNGKPRLTRTGALAALAVLAAFDLLFWFFAVRPLGDQEAMQQARIAALTNTIQEKEDSVEKLTQASEKVSGAQAEGDLLLENLTFERRTTYSRLLTELGRAAEEAGIEIRETNYNADEIEGTGEFGMVSISANFRGQYDNLVKFVHALDRSETFLIVERLGAVPRQEGGLQISMRIDAFVRGL